MKLLEYLKLHPGRWDGTRNAPGRLRYFITGRYALTKKEKGQLNRNDK